MDNKYDHDAVRCDLMMEIDSEVLEPGELASCCVCIGHQCDVAKEERKKHPKKNLQCSQCKPGHA